MNKSKSNCVFAFRYEWKKTKTTHRTCMLGKNTECLDNKYCPIWKG